MTPEECASIRSIARWVLPVLVGPSTAVTPLPGARPFEKPGGDEEKLIFARISASRAFQDCFTMQRLEERDLSLGTGTERNAPESLTPILACLATATCGVDSHAGALDQVGLGFQSMWTSPYLLIAGVESEAAKSQAESCTVIPGRALRANPESRGRRSLLDSGFAPKGRATE